MNAEASSSPSAARRLGLTGGGILFLILLVLPAPGGMDPAAWKTTAVAILMAVWWITEAIPIPVTALLPLVLFPGLGILSMADAAEPYANELIFLFMGGFLLAAGMERWGLHRRIALRIMTWVGSGAERLVLGFMLASAFLSMWISNTATAAMMFPIGIAVGALHGRQEGEDHPLGVALMLGIAYGASIGGVATLIGTPPNALLAGAAQEMFGIEIGFIQWMSVGLPLSLILLPLAWLLLVRVLYPPGPLGEGTSTLLEEEVRGLGSMSRGERSVAVVFSLTVLAWLMRTPKALGALTVPGLQDLIPGVRDSTIAIAGSIALFLIPVDWRAGRFALDWKSARGIPWDVLVLFGGGLSLARAMETSGLAAWIGGGVAGLGNLPTWVIILSVATLFVFLTEITSNTATASMAMPVLAGAAAGLEMAPLALMSTGAMAASMAFMLPVATPPNAIVFGSDYLTIPRMARAGLWLNLLAIALITAVATYLVPLVLL